MSSSSQPSASSTVHRVQFAIDPALPRRMRRGSTSSSQPVLAPPRIARMLAFALDVRDAVEAGAYRDLSDAARELGLSRARMSQLIDLTLLAPDIQEEILAMRVPAGRQLVNERVLRALAGEDIWDLQRDRWRRPEGSRS